MEKINTDLHYFDKKGVLKTIKNCKLLNNFRFSKAEFFLVDVGGRYNICVSRDGELYAIWAQRKGDFNPSQSVSTFRNQYIKNNITAEKIEQFLKKPKKYGKAFN